MLSPSDEMNRNIAEPDAKLTIACAESKFQLFTHRCPLTRLTTHDVLPENGTVIK